MRSLRGGLLIRVWLMCLCLGNILLVSGCGESRILVAPGETTGVARLGKAVRDWPVWLPSTDKKSWVPAKADIPEGAWINFSAVVQ